MKIKVQYIKDVVSLRWKLLIPFLFLPAALTVFLVGWSVYSDWKLLTSREQEEIMHNYHDFSHAVDVRLQLSAAVAKTVTEDLFVKDTLNRKDRPALLEKYRPIFNDLRDESGLSILHFHLRPARSFLRLHREEMHGGDLSSYRPGIVAAQETGRPVAGLFMGISGFGLRAIAPCFLDGQVIGSVEAGYFLNRDILSILKQRLGSDLAIYLPSPFLPSGVRMLAETDYTRSQQAGEAYRQVLQTGTPVFLTVATKDQDLALYLHPLLAFDGSTSGVIEIIRDRTSLLAEIRHHSYLIAISGLAVFVLAVFFVLKISSLFLAPIKALVEQAEKITAGEQVPFLEIYARDEFGALTIAVNEMLASIEESKRRLENYALELEAKVQERTAELVESEEKYRTLVDHIPLAVYRLERGLIRSFVSSHIEKMLGRPAETLVGPPDVWTQTIHPADRETVLKLKKISMDDAATFEMEYRLVDVGGQEIAVVDHAEPVFGEHGFSFMEGYLLDVRERKRYEIQTVQAEELRTLNEISARLAHEFRNPLSIVGLSARRLAKTLPESAPGTRHTAILIEEVGRLEKILNMILTYIRPMGLNLVQIDTETFFRRLARETRKKMAAKHIDLELQLEKDLPPIDVDPDLMLRALLNLLQNAAFQMSPKSRLGLSVSSDGGGIEVKMVYPAGYLPDDQLRHFFYPFTTEEADTSLVDLPLVPVIVHKHRGYIHVGREGDDLVAVTITLPAAVNRPV